MSPPNEEPATEMRIDPARAQTLVANLAGVLQKINAANTTTPPIRLIAVSKLKPASDILALHTASPQNPTPHTDFGENYAQELTEKAALLPSSIRWHFIGALQTNKCKGLARDVKGLVCVGSVDSAKKARELEKGCVEAGKEEGGLGVHVQVNTSGEESKSGVAPEEAAGVARVVVQECPHLVLRGLMTIGAIARSKSAAEGTDGNEDFEELARVRGLVEKELGLEGLELSMGMSEDFEQAIRQGATEVRVGSTIFGERPARKDAKVKDDVEEGAK